MKPGGDDTGHAGTRVRVMDTSSVTRVSIWVIARDEADVHKWIESVHNNRDMGVEAIRDWYMKHFRKFVRGKLMDHIKGKCLIEEFNESAFNILQVFEFKCPIVREKLETGLRDGCQNLEIVVNAVAENEDVEEIVEFLEVVDMNRCHDLNPPIDVLAEV